MSLLETKDLKKIYRVGKVDVEALRGVSVSVNAGEFVAIMGPSGSGKSTLMHILGAMTRPTSGKVFIEGRDTSDMNDSARTEIRRKKLGFVFQKFNLLPALTARQNIQVARKIYGEAPNPASEAHLKDILSLLQIEGKLDRRPSELSGGEQQRVAIARALTNNPSILLADEPTGALDSKNSEIVLTMFQELNKRLKQTILLVTHNPELAAYTNRLIEMRDGLVVTHAAP
jgi:putative ABC transport system ATP-binding protein